MAPHVAATNNFFPKSISASNFASKMILWPAVCHTAAASVKICQKLRLSRGRLLLSLASFPHGNADHKMYGLEKLMTAGASGLIVHGKMAMLDARTPPPEIWVSVLLLAVAVYMDL